MKRRNVLTGLGALAGASGIAGTGAFTSVSAERSVEVSVAGDDSALLRLGPCTHDSGNESGNELPNGAYVDPNPDGTFALDFSDTNDNDPPTGGGVNNEALSIFDHVFEVCNQGTQSICVDLQLDEVPLIPQDATVPSRYDFGPGDLAIAFYLAGDRTETFDVDELNADRSGAIHLKVGECQCFGVEIRAFGFDTGTLFENASMEILADADADCGGQNGGGGGGSGEFEREWANTVKSNDLGTKKNGDSLDDDRSDTSAATGPRDGNFVSLGFGGQIKLGFDDQLVDRPNAPDTLVVETTNSRDNFPEETAEIAVSGPNTNGFEVLGTASSKNSNGENAFELQTESVTAVRIMDTTDPGPHNGNADGFDVDAVGGWKRTT